MNPLGCTLEGCACAQMHAPENADTYFLTALAKVLSDVRTECLRQHRECGGVVARADIPITYQETLEVAATELRWAMAYRNRNGHKAITNALTAARVGEDEREPLKDITGCDV